MKAYNIICLIGMITVIIVAMIACTYTGIAAATLDSKGLAVLSIALFVLAVTLSMFLPEPKTPETPKETPED